MNNKYMNKETKKHNYDKMKYQLFSIGLFRRGFSWAI